MLKRFSKILVLAVLVPSSGAFAANKCSDVFSGQHDVEIIRRHHVLSGSKDGRVTLTNSTTGESRELMKLNSSVSSLDLSDDGNRVVAGFDDGSLAIWNLAKNRLELSDEHPAAPLNHSIKALFFHNQEGSQIFTLSSDGRVTVTKPETGEASELIKLNVSSHVIDQAKDLLSAKGGSLGGPAPTASNARIIVRPEDQLLVLLVANKFPQMNLETIVTKYTFRLRGQAAGARLNPQYSTKGSYLDLSTQFKITAAAIIIEQIAEDLEVSANPILNSQEMRLIGLLGARQ